MGPFAYKGDQWISFDDIDTIKQKIKFLKDLNLGGVMVWALDLDDFQGSCQMGSEKYPLLKTINRELGLLNDGKSNDHLLLETTISNEIYSYPGRTLYQQTFVPFFYQSCSKGPYYPSPDDCAVYYQCSGKDDEYLRLSCPPGLHWDQNLSVCNWPANAGCDVGESSNEIDDGDMSVISQPSPQPSKPSPIEQTSVAPPLETTVTTISTEKPSVENTGMKVVCCK